MQNFHNPKNSIIQGPGIGNSKLNWFLRTDKIRKLAFILAVSLILYLENQYQIQILNRL